MKRQVILIDGSVQSAEKGFPHAYNALGVMAYNGILVPQDYELANRMFEIGAAAGEMDSLFNLGAQYLAGNGVEKDLQKGFNYLKKANRAGQWQAPLQVEFKPYIKGMAGKLLIQSEFLKVSTSLGLQLAISSFRTTKALWQKVCFTQDEGNFCLPSKNLPA